MSKFAGLIVKGHQVRESTANIDCDDEHGNFRLSKLKEAALFALWVPMAMIQVAILIKAI